MIGVNVGFKVVLKPIKAIKRYHIKPQSPIVKLSRICVGICHKDENGEFIMRVPTFELNAYAEENNERINEALLVLPLTRESYSLKGREKIFSKVKGKHGYECRIRNYSQAVNFPNIDEMFTSVCEKWVHSGWVVRQDGQLKFHLRDALTPEGYDYEVPHPELDDNR